MAARNTGLLEMEKGMVDKLEVENTALKLENSGRSAQRKRGLDNLAFADDHEKVGVDGGDADISAVEILSENPSKRLVTFKRAQVVRTVEGFEPVPSCSSVLTEPPRNPPAKEDLEENDDAKPMLLQKPPVPTEVPAKRLASLKRASTRIVVPAGPIETSEPIPSCSSSKDQKAALVTDDLDEIQLADPEPSPPPVPEPRVRVTYCRQPPPKRNFFGMRKLQVDLSSPPIELPEDIEINRGCCNRSRCTQTKRKRIVQCGCVILAIIIILIIIFIQDEPEAEGN